MIMKVFMGFILLLFSCQLAGQPDPYLADSLKKMADKDKYVRQRVDSAFKKYGKDSPQWKKAWNRMQLTDKKHNAALKDILAKLNSYPGMDKAGEDGAHYFWVLVLHQDADLAFQRQVLDLMKIAYENHVVEPGDYAYFYDRILVNGGYKQIYGTQVYYDEEKKMYVPHPLMEPATTDEKRAEMQMPPMAEYMRIMNDPKKIKF